MITMIKSHKVRIYLTPEQEDKVQKHMGCSRYVYNYMVDMQTKNYENGGKFISRFSMINMITELRKENEWMKETSRYTQDLVCRDVDRAFKNFFDKRAKYPRFKSKRKGKQSYPVNSNNFYFKDEKYLNIEKIGKVRYKTDFDFPIGRKVCKFSNVRITKVRNKWMLSFGMECENQARDLNDFSIGIDLGIKDLAVVECNNNCIVYNNINKSEKIRKLKRRIQTLQRTISRKYRANNNRKTNNIIRCEKELRRLLEKVANIRDNYIHQMTHQIVEMLPKRVVMEDLNVLGMMKNRHLSRAIAEQCFNKVITYMKYKCEWNGIEFVQADRFYPSSRTCSCCGEVKHDLRLRDRVFACPNCGFEIDRDYNAAINLSRYTA